MNLLIISHKETWAAPASPTGFASTGGFPYQVQALSTLFTATRVITALRQSPPPAGLTPLTGHNLTVTPLPEPTGSDLRRKLALLTWFPRHFRTLWRAVRAADAVHTPVPGDLGTIGLLIALAQRKPLFVRHCGTWGDRSTLANRFLAWLLPRIAGGRNVVLATGGDAAPPEPANPAIDWIFSTTLTAEEWEQLPQSRPWTPGQLLRLVTVGRLSPAKNTAAAIQALPILRSAGLPVHLDIVGSGEARPALEHLAASLGLSALVTFHGNVPHARVLEILSAAHLFVFPTRVKEGFPKALIEALSCGLPAIATRVSVIPRLLQDCGLTLDDPTPDALAAAIQSLTADPARLPALAHAARLASQGYTLEAWAAAIAAKLTAAWGKEAISLKL